MKWNTHPCWSGETLGLKELRADHRRGYPTFTEVEVRSTNGMGVGVAARKGQRNLLASSWSG